MATKITPSSLLASLRSRGVRLRVTETAEGLQPSVSGELTAEDRRALEEHREGLIALLLEEARVEAGRREDPRAATRDVRFWGPDPNRIPGGLRREEPA